MSDHGSIHWSELVSTDVDASKAFFANQAGWTYDGMDMGNGMYWVAKKGEVPVAGIISIEMIEGGAVPPHWMTYIAVDDIDKVVAETEAGGGTVVRPAFDVPGVGRIAMLTDPGGATVGMMTPAAQG